MKEKLGAASAGGVRRIAAAPLSRRLVGFELARGSILSIGLVFAVALALATGLPPAVRAMRLKIVDALAGR